MVAEDVIAPVAGVNPWVYVILGGMTMVSSIVVGWFAYDGRKHSKEANEAVNQRHLKGVDANGNPVTPRLYDAMLGVVEDVGELKTNQQVIKTEVVNARGHLFEVSKHVSELDRDLKTHIGESDTRYQRLEEKIDTRVPERVAETVIERLQPTPTKQGEDQ
jgi:hypothetical protein